MFRDRGIEIKTREQILSMRAAGLVVGRTLELLRGEVRAGITTGELDAIAEDNIRSSGATPSFKGYHGFPGSICTSVDDEVVHGIPGERILEDYVGHGIGSAMHQPPNVPNYGRPGRGPKLVQGLALAVEPMVTLGGK